MSIQLLKYTTIDGNKMEMKGGPPNSWGIEMLFISCTSDEREKLLRQLPVQHNELKEKGI